jgi:hypothetical protein
MVWVEIANFPPSGAYLGHCAPPPPLHPGFIELIKFGRRIPHCCTGLEAFESVGRSEIFRVFRDHSHPHGRMAGGGNGLPKSSLGPALHYLSTPCGRTVSGLAGSQDRQSAAVFHPLDTPYIYDHIATAAVTIIIN